MRALGLIVLLAGCSVVQAPPVPIAPDELLAGEFRAATEWTPVELTFPSPFRSPGTRFQSVEEIELLLRQYFALGVRPIDAEAVRVVVPGEAEVGTEFRLFVELEGGVNGAQAGSQFRIWVRRDGSGWRVDPTAEIRQFCRREFSGIRRNLCVSE